MKETKTETTETVKTETETKAMPKAVLLGRCHNITPFCSTDESRYVLQGVHYNAEKKVLEATNGRFCIRVPVVVDKEGKEGSFPISNDPNTEPEDCIIPAAALLKALKNMPKNGSLPILHHARMNTQRTQSVKEGATVESEFPKIRLTTTDLDQEESVVTKAIEGQYPNVDQVIPEPGSVTKGALTEFKTLTLDAIAAVAAPAEAKDEMVKRIEEIFAKTIEDQTPWTTSIALHPEYVKIIATYALKHGKGSEPSIKFNFKDSISPVTFEISLDTEIGEPLKATGVLIPMRLS